VTVKSTNLAGKPDTGGTVYLVKADNSPVIGDPASTASVFSTLVRPAVAQPS